MADIKVGSRVCWTGWISDSYGRVLSKNYGADTVQIRLDEGKVTTAPSSEIRSASTCRVTRGVKDEGWELLFDILTSPSETDQN